MKECSELVLLQTFEEVLYLENAIFGQIGAVDGVFNSVVAKLSAINFVKSEPLTESCLDEGA